jgi:hypothetical protein
MLKWDSVFRKQKEEDANISLSEALSSGYITEWNLVHFVTFSSVQGV